MKKKAGTQCATEHKVVFCTGICCAHKGSKLALQNFSAGLERERSATKVETMQCSGNCHLAPLVFVDNRPMRLSQLPGLALAS